MGGVAAAAADETLIVRMAEYGGWAKVCRGNKAGIGMSAA
jgi:hypothetical protein